MRRTEIVKSCAATTKEVVVSSSRRLYSSTPLVLLVGNACPWCHRCTLTLALRKLSNVRVLQLVDDAERASRGGWVLPTPDVLFPGCSDLRQVYDALVPGGYRGRCTAPLLVNARTRQAVSNDSESICRLLNGLPPPGGVADVDLCPPHLAEPMTQLCASITRDVNNAVYQSGFATTQLAYNDVQKRLWAAFDELEARLCGSRFLVGEKLTLADVLLYPTAARFDAIYTQLFKCNNRRIRDYVRLHAWLRDVSSLAGVSGTLDLASAKASYFRQLFPLNPSLIVPFGPTTVEVGSADESDSVVFHLRG